MLTDDQIKHVQTFFAPGSEMHAICNMALMNNKLSECVDEAVNGLEWLKENKPKILDESDYEKLAKWKLILAEVES